MNFKYIGAIMAVDLTKEEELLMAFQISVRNFGFDYMDIRDRLPKTSLEIVEDYHARVSLFKIKDEAPTVKQEIREVSREKWREHDQLRAIRRVLYASAYSAIEQFLIIVVKPPRNKKGEHLEGHIRMKIKLEKILKQSLSEAGLETDWAAFQEMRKIRNSLTHNAGLVHNGNTGITSDIVKGEIPGVWVDPLFKRSNTDVIVIGELYFLNKIPFLGNFSQTVWDKVHSSSQG